MVVLVMLDNLLITLIEFIARTCLRLAATSFDRKRRWDAPGIPLNSNIISLPVYSFNPTPPTLDGWLAVHIIVCLVRALLLLVMMDTCTIVFYWLWSDRSVISIEIEFLPSHHKSTRHQQQHLDWTRYVHAAPVGEQLGKSEDYTILYNQSNRARSFSNIHPSSD